VIWLLKLRNWYWARCRAMDMDVLWPTCVAMSPDIDHARAVFMVHAMRDPAWIDFYGEQQLIEEVGKLE
jgi:hypothetical protein